MGLTPFYKCIVLSIIPSLLFRFVALIALILFFFVAPSLCFRNVFFVPVLKHLFFFVPPSQDFFTIANGVVRVFWFCYMYVLPGESWRSLYFYSSSMPLSSSSSIIIIVFAAAVCVCLSVCQLGLESSSST